MVLPGKTADYKDSVISKFPVILEIVTARQFCSVRELAELTKEKFSSATEFVQTMDCLFALGKIEMNEDKNGVSICL
jgi:hypothetical protein